MDYSVYIAIFLFDRHEWKTTAAWPRNIRPKHYFQTQLNYLLFLMRDMDAFSGLWSFLGCTIDQ